ncbi:MAG: NADH-quinone oxidoreductase subunit H, partial [Candidatus Obscuribacterales bacterium]|nr:NADH-quinone oxidoreductase subunit H [Candidatus Obscuribacterales bacterium]
QNRRGAPIIQPLIDLLKFSTKGEVVSFLTSWIFRGAPAIQLAIMLIIAFLAPWTTLKPALHGSDLFLIVYLLAFMRLISVLAALDTGSAFTGFGASREVTLAVLIEPAIVLCCVALACVGHTSDLSQIFSFSNQTLRYDTPLWLICGTGLFLSSIVELSRMPVDDPTTHLELTMVHEAMILENSGRNLMLIDYGHNLKLIVMLGLAGECFVHAIPSLWVCGQALQMLASVVALMTMILSIAIIEATNVKLQWTKVPAFIAYAIVMAVVSVFIAIGRS